MWGNSWQHLSGFSEKDSKERFSGEGTIIQTLPLLSSVVITILGFGIAIQARISGGIIQIDSAIKVI